MFYEVLKQSGSKSGLDHLKILQQQSNEEATCEIIAAAMKFPLLVLDPSFTENLTYKNVGSYLWTLRGVFSATGNEQVVAYVIQLAGYWKKDTLVEEMNLEKFYIGLQARNQLISMSAENDDVLQIILLRYASLLDEQTLKMIHSHQATQEPSQ